jgi:hypothetical protein
MKLIIMGGNSEAPKNFHHDLQKIFSLYFRFDRCAYTILFCIVLHRLDVFEQKYVGTVAIDKKRSKWSYLLAIQELFKTSLHTSSFECSQLNIEI